MYVRKKICFSKLSYKFKLKKNFTFFIRLFTLHVVVILTTIITMNSQKNSYLNSYEYLICLETGVVLITHLYPILTLNRYIFISGNTVVNELLNDNSCQYNATIFSNQFGLYLRDVFSEIILECALHPKRENVII